MVVCKIHWVVGSCQTWGSRFNCTARIVSRILFGKGLPEPGFVGLPQSHGHGDRRDGPRATNGLAHVDSYCDKAGPAPQTCAASASKPTALIDAGPMMTGALVATMSTEDGSTTNIIGGAHR